MMFAKQIKLKSLKMKPKSFVMEFDEKHIPKRELLLKSADVTKLKISIEATKNLRIAFSDEEQKNTPKNSLFDEALLLLNHFT
jgi:predicted protein tyrosine phosphatase